MKNNSPADSMNYVKIVATLYDNTGKVVGTDFTYPNVDVLRPEEKSSFEIILDDAAQSQKVDSYKLLLLETKHKVCQQHLNSALVTTI